jgi:glucokinase
MVDNIPERPCLVADIGGTNTRVALASGPNLLTDSIRRFRNRDHKGLEPVLASYLEAQGVREVSGVCAAVAGPVKGGSAALTNLDWSMSENSIAKATGAPRVSLLNDLQAQGHAVGHIPPENLIPVIEVNSPPPGAPALVIGVGTGFNAAPVHHRNGGALVAASECGHANLPVRTEDDLALNRFVEASHGFPAIEDVLSGRGIEAVDAFLGGPDTPRRAAAEIMAALQEGETRATETGRIFVKCLGTVVGNLALIHLPFRGIYLVGGVARAFGPHLAALGFHEAFRDKGRFSEFMDAFPVHLVEDDFAALSGMAAHLRDLLSR